MIVDENARQSVSYLPKPATLPVIEGETTLVMPKTWFRLKLYNVGCVKSNFQVVSETKQCGVDTPTSYNRNSVYQRKDFEFHARIFTCEGMITVNPNQQVVFGL